VSTPERYLKAIAAFDWEAAGRCLTDDVERIGPLGPQDVYRGRQTYLEYLEGLMPKLPEYRMNIGRVFSSADQRQTAVELSEEMLIDGRPSHTDECLVFELDEHDLIRRIAVYIQRE
jgi:SnoaL-like domain